MSVKVITDTASDFPLNDDSRVILLPMNITFNNVEYQDVYELSHEEFYSKLQEEESLPSTSQINPTVFEKTYKKIIEEGDEAVVITMSSSLSGTYQNALLVSDDYSDKIFTVDSLNATVGELVLVRRALQLIDEGKRAKEIQEILNEEKHNICLYGIVDTLDYLKKGGRISATAAFVGSALGIKPLLSIDKGVINVLAKPRGSKKANSLMSQTIIDNGGICFNKPVAAGYAGLSNELLVKYLEDANDVFDNNLNLVEQQSIGGTIGTHVGPNTIIVAYFSK